MKRTVAVIALGVFLTGVYFALKLLPWWAWVLGIFGVFVLGQLFIGRLFRRLLVIPFKAKGAVLRGAAAQVNSVNPLPGNEGDNRVGYEVDVTITPPAATGNFSLWGPGELCLVPPDSKIDIDGDSGDDICSIDTVEVEENGEFKADEGLKYGGTQRVKLRISVSPEINALKFRYYFEEFGEVRLPGGLAQAA